MFNIKKIKDRIFEKEYRIQLKKLNSFFGLNFIEENILVFILKEEQMKEFLQTKKEYIPAGGSTGNCIFLMDRRDYCKRYKGEDKKNLNKRYSALMVHEMSHIFFNSFSGMKKNYPVWLYEGVAIYLSGQNKFKEKPKELKNFIKFYDKSNREIYKESGFVVEFLIKRYGKKKLLNLIKNLRKANGEKEFNKLFKKTYGFDLNYRRINSK